MFKVIGAVFIIAGCASVGLLAERRLILRIKALSSILPALDILKAEIGELLTPIPEALEFLSKSASYPASGLFQKTYEAMKQNGSSFSKEFSSVLLNDAPGYGFSKTDLHILMELTPVLGRYGASEQAQKLIQVIHRLHEQRDEADEALNRRGRLYKTFGVMFGIIVVLVTF